MSGRRTAAARSPTPRSASKTVRHSPDALQRRKHLDHPDIELGEEAGEKSDAGQYQQTPHHLFHVREMGAKARQESGERLDRERGDQERNAEPERVDRQ